MGENEQAPLAGSSFLPAQESHTTVLSIRTQRRLLEAVSLVCSAYYWFHISINTDSNLMTIPVHVGSTRYALLTLWMTLVWAAWRYGQQLYRLSTEVRDTTRKDYRTELSRLANKVVQRYADGMSPSDRRAFGDENAKPKVVGFALLGRFDFEQARRFDANNKEVVPQLPFGPLAERSHAVIDTEIEWLVGDGGTRVDFGLGISRGLTIWLKVTAAIAATFRRPAILDYAAPALLFLFGLLSLVLATIHRPLAAVCV
jgi:hypothetical protein